MSFHVSAQSVRAVAGGLVAAAALLSGLALAPTAMAADSATADNAPSVAGHAYNELPYNNPDVTVTQIDNSALPSYMGRTRVLTPRTIFRRTTTLQMHPR